MSHAKVAMFRARILGHAERECVATQDAIDALAAEHGGGRARFIEQLGRTTDAELCDLILVAWAKAPLELATGLSRDQWCDVFRTETRT